jgi:membrane-associated phospholipid phosphatase
MDLGRGPRGQGAYEPGATIECAYVERALNGRSPKFACQLPDGGDELKIKYGEMNGEVQGEVAATRLLWALGFGADGMYPVRVICRGCPSTIGVTTDDPGKRLVEPAAVEWKLPGRELHSGDQEGWSWPELDLVSEEAGGAPRAERDALKLLAVFLQHTDSKPEQQRLLCLDAGEATENACERPFMMINDVGLTFGRANLGNANAVGSVNFREWSSTPIWKDDRACVGNLPRSLTGTLRDPVISEAGRRFLAQLLERLSDAQIHALFEGARMDMRSVDAQGNRQQPEAVPIDEWVRVFKAKREEIVNRRCDALWPGGLAALFGTAPIKWLQARGSRTVTAVMNGISLVGYTRVYVAIAIALAFLVRLRAGAALLVLLALTGVLTDGAKVLVSSPRPDAVDTGVRTLSAIETMAESFRSNSAAASVDADDGYGFPSGHVAATTAFFFGLLFLFRWPWAWKAMLVAVPVMALSRVYLGRHFIGDVLGGFGVGVIAVSIALLALTLGRLCNPARAFEAAGRTLLVAGACALVALSYGIPAPYDAGRLLGFAAGAMLLVFHEGSCPDNGTYGTSTFTRVWHLALAAAMFTLAWWGVNTAIDAADLRNTPSGALLAGAVPAFAVLAAGKLQAVFPFLLGRDTRLTPRNAS